MRSLKNEVKNLTKQVDGWYGTNNNASTSNTTPPTPTPTPTPSSGRRSGGIKRKLHQHTQSNNNTKRHIVNARETTSFENREKITNLVDEDYIAFLNMLDENGDLYSNSKEEDVDPDNENSVEEYNNVEDDDVDPDYKIFLENVREYGNSYVFEMTKDDGEHVFVMYEEKEEKKPKEYEIGIHDDEDNSDDTTSSQQRQSYLNVQPLDVGFEKITECSGKKDDLEAPHWFLLDCKPGTISSADESYLKFLDHLWVKGDSLMYECEDVIVQYEEDGVGIDSEEPRQRDITYGNEKIAPFTNPNTSTAMDENEDDSDSVQILDDTDYEEKLKKNIRNKLREVLQKPFDGKEYIEMLKAAKAHKPLERTRITRGRAVSYPTDRRSKSYLDLHPDLADMLKNAQLKLDKRRALALLRCLFFYYEHVSHQGSFIPWKNPPVWLHEIICCCPENSECLMKHHMSQGNRQHHLNESTEWPMQLESV